MDIRDELDLLREKISDLQSRVMNTASRGTLMADDDSKPIQQMKVRGQWGEEFDRVQRWEQFGITSRAPENSDALIMSINGSRDSAQVVAIENSGMRPTGSGPGSTTVYDAGGSTIVLDGSGNITITAAQNLTIVAQDIEITSDTLTNNGVDISDSHLHTRVMSGAANTGVPVGG